MPANHGKKQDTRRGYKKEIMQAICNFHKVPLGCMGFHGKCRNCTSSHVVAWSDLSFSHIGPKQYEVGKFLSAGWNKLIDWKSEFKVLVLHCPECARLHTATHEIGRTVRTRYDWATYKNLPLDYVDEVEGEWSRESCLRVWNKLL
jgi:hypothetical protein